MSRTTPPKRPPPQAKKTTGLHPRNRHQGHYDFDALMRTTPELKAFVILNPYGKRSIDFADPHAVRTLNRALLCHLYGIRHWDIPDGYLCPPVPGRADYIHGLADLLAEDAAGRIPRGVSVRALDIGTGANCIYPLLGHGDYGWHFVGADIDERAMSAAGAMLAANGLEPAIELRRQTNPDWLFRGIVQPGERFELTLCNPPFHTNADEAHAGSRRKWKNLGKLDPKRKLPTLNFGGQSNELWCPGGELAFLRRMIEESEAYATQVLWFTSLVSKGGNLDPLQRALGRTSAVEVRVAEMAQGQKRSRFLAWSFHDARTRKEWLKP
ncbi:23S rRNA (adenine(1618)-N(6))-methyltransferase RlmF [Pseudomonas matsuisoli]|nr:23S rRNA (adenine(1618)-N(6))-methyltransferase RlmF [Pseudomonas matsuisoli]